MLLQRFRFLLFGLISGVLLVTAWLLTRHTGIMVFPVSMNRTPQSPATSFTNRLTREKSPYLLMHAHNPVDWYPWGEEAFEKARREQKPIFLSVGYSTCHWCHVMERESFSDPVTSEIMNRHFVNIKVDREERPDVDRIYMAYVQATTGSGGWPMSVFLTPNLEPFFGGTYFPPDDRYGRLGFRTLLHRVAEVWAKDRDKITESAGRFARHLEQATRAEVGGSANLDERVLQKAYQEIKASYDPAFAGFGGAPKFPRPVVFNFLLRYSARTKEKDALEMTLATLRAMARGGIHDHIGGGFHRYATDAAWEVPHFEKMLYDQAQLAVSYVEAYQLARDPFYAQVARDILDYVLRDMCGSEGAFYSAEDADSLIEHGKPEHGEGAFYVWKTSDIERVLRPSATAIFNFYYGVEPAGNVPADKDPHQEFRGKNILMIRHSLAETAVRFGKSEAEVEATLSDSRRKLLAARSGRPRPAVDDKVLVAWNGLALTALARASQVLDEPRYLAAALRAAAFLRSKLYDATSGRLNRRYRAGEVAIDGFLDDYAFLIQGLLDLYESSFDVRWLSWAVQLQARQDELFGDTRQGGYYSTTAAAASILVRMRDDYDGAEPSANSVAAMNLLRLAEMTGRPAWRESAEKLFAAFAPRLHSNPEASPQLAAALDFKLSVPKQIIIAGDPEAADTLALLRLVYDRFIPNKILLVTDGAQGQKQLAGWLPLIESMTRKHGRATAYVCENYACKLPTSDPAEFARLLDGESRPRIS